MCDSITRPAVSYFGVPLRVVLTWSILQSTFQGIPWCYPEKSTEVDLTSDTLNLASGNLDTLGCLGVQYQICRQSILESIIDYCSFAFSLQVELQYRVDGGK